MLPSESEKKREISARLFPRSFKYEIDCIEQKRLEKLHEKTLREEEEDRSKFKYRNEKTVVDNYPVEHKLYAEKRAKLPAKLTGRWQETPDIISYSTDSDCIRRWEMAR